MSKSSLKVALITDEMSPIVTSLANSEHELIAIASFGERDKFPLGLLTLSFNVAKRLFYTSEPTIAEYCRNLQLAHFSFSKKNIDSLFNFIRKLEVDVIVLYCVPLMPKELLDTAKICTLNLHPSLLPEYRGADPSTHMVLDNSLDGGVTLHKVDCSEDTGEILLQSRVKITPGMLRSEYIQKAVFENGVRLLADALKGINNNTLESFQQDEKSPTARAKRLTNEEIYQTIKWDDWSIERVWFTLRFFQERKQFLPKAINWRKWFDPVIANFVVDPRSAKVIGGERLVQSGKASYFLHQEGRIYIEYPFSFKQLVKRLLRQ